jgi:arabinogalactan oligomer/maltooligosaccharide transport system substrate-binding protein
VERNESGELVNLYRLGPSVGIGTDDTLLDVSHRILIVAAPINWGDVPSWLSASAGLAALTFAVVAVVVARRTYQLESERDHVNAEARLKQDAFVRRTQAALVSAWWAKEDANRSDEDGRSWAVHMRNASDTPVYKVHITIIGMGSHAKRKTLELPLVPPTSVPVAYPIDLPGITANSDADSTGHPLADYRVSLRFTDAAGVRWIRDEYGSLRELEPNLLIWTSPEVAAVVTPFTTEFLATYGVTAECDTTLIEAELEKHFIDSDPGPDILIGPHDWVGSLVNLRLIEPITLSDQRIQSFAPEHLNPFSFNGELYAIPSSLDTVALIRNTDLVPNCPKTFEELLAVAQELRDRNMVTEIMAVPVGPRGDPFHMWPIFTGAGGWLFERQKDSSWNPSKQGITATGTLHAFETIRMLGMLGVLRLEIDPPRSIELFIRRQTPFLLATSGAVIPLRNSGVSFEVSALPRFRGRRSPSVSFLTVNGFYIASNGRNKVVASDLVPDYLTRADVTETFGRLAHVIPLRLTDECAPAIVKFHELSSAAVPMPSFPQMREVWNLLASAELSLIDGEDASAVAGNLSIQMQALFSN